MILSQKATHCLFSLHHSAAVLALAFKLVQLCCFCNYAEYFSHLPTEAHMAGYTNMYVCRKIPNFPN